MTIVATALAGGDAQEAARAVARETKLSLGGAPPQFVMACASTAQPLEEVMRVLADEFPSAVLVGASARRERGGGFHNTTSVVLAFPED